MIRGTNRRLTYQPRLETLEDRCVPANLPVVIVPGLFGSLPIDVSDAGRTAWGFNLGVQPSTITIEWNFPGLGMSPYIQTVDAFENAGYVLGTDLFLAPYDWRLSIAPSDGNFDGHLTGVTAASVTDNVFNYGVDYLGHVLAQVAQTWATNNPGVELPGVTIVAHSMGNLVTRAYIQSDAYNGTFTVGNNTFNLPRVNNFVMLAGPNQGASEIFNPMNNNFFNSQQTEFRELAVQLFLDGVFDVVTGTNASLLFPDAAPGTPVNGPDGQPLVTLGSVTNPMTLNPDPHIFNSQYAPGLRDLAPTYDFLDGTNINSNASIRNNLLLDMNGGPDPNSFAANKAVNSFYGDTTPTFSTTTTSYGQGGTILPVSLTVMGTRMTQDGEVWYNDNLVNSGDGTVALASLQSTFNGDLRIKQNPLPGITHGTVVTDPATLQLIIQAAMTPFVQDGLIVAGADQGAPPQVNAYNATTGQLQFSFNAFAAGFLGGVRVASGDFNRDNVPDMIVGAGPGAGPNIVVFSGVDGSALASFFAFDSGFTGGVNVAAGDVNGDGYVDVIVGADAGAAPHVRVFSGKDLSLLLNFMAYDMSFLGGVRVGASDVDHDNRFDVLTVPGAGGGANVKIFRGSDGVNVSSFFAFNASITTGFYIAGGNFDATGFDDYAVSKGAGGDTTVALFRGSNLSQIATFQAYAAGFLGGVRIGAADLDLNGLSEIITGPGSGLAPEVVVRRADTLAVIDSFFAFDQTYLGGIFVAGGA